LVVAALLSAGAYFMHSWQLSRLSRALLRYAEAQQEKENWTMAASYLDRYLRVHPEDVSARGDLATVIARGANSPAQRRRAVELHYRALADEPPKPDAVRLRGQLAELLVKTGRHVEAEREARKVIAASPDDAVAHRSLAISLFAQWTSGALATIKHEDLHILRTAENARRRNPGDAVLAELTAAIYRQHSQLVLPEFPGISDRDRAAAADACLDELVAQRADDAESWLTRFRYRTQYELPGAAPDLQRALDLAPSDSKVLLTAAAAACVEARYLQSQGAEADVIRDKFAGAQRHYETAIQLKSPNLVPDAYLGLGDSLVGQEKLNEALNAWKEGLNRFAQPTIQVLFHSRTADALLAAGRAEKAAEPLAAVDAIIAALGASVTREERLALLQAQDFRRASWQLQSGRPAAAIPLLSEVLARQAAGVASGVTGSAAWILLGRANATLGEWGEAAVAFDRATLLETSDAGPRLASAYAWLQVGRYELAARRAEEAAAVQPSVESWFVLAAAEYQLQLGLPAKSRSWSRLNRALVALEQVPAAQFASAPWRVDFLRAELANVKGRDAGEAERGRHEALQALTAAEDKHARAPEFWRQVCLVYQRLESPSDANRALARLQAIEASSVELALLKARLAVLRKEYAQAAAVLEESAKAAAAGDRSRLRLELVDVALAQRDLETASRLLAAEAKQRPEEVSLLRRLAELALEQGDLDGLANWERALNAAGPLGQWWSRYFRAVRMYTSAKSPQDPQLVQALEEQGRLAAIRPEWALSFTLRGMIAERMLRLEDAVLAYERAAQLGERRITILERLIALLDRLNRPAEAEKYLSRLEGYLPYSQRLTEIAAAQHVRHDRPEQALELARAAVAKRPDDAMAHLWLGRLMMLNQQQVEAEAELNRARELAPKDVRTYNGLFSFYLRSKNTSRARDILRELEQEAELDVADRNFVVAQGLELLGQWDEAQARYELATRSAPDRAILHVRLAGVYLRRDPTRAVASLRKALEIDPQLPLARRMLAAQLAAGGSAAGFREAEQLLVGQGDSQTPVAVEDRRLNAILLAQYGNPDQAQRAVHLLEDLVANSNESVPADRLVLSRLYENQARNTLDQSASNELRQLARKHLIETASAADAEPGHLAALVDFLHRNGDSDLAKVWLDNLEAMLHRRTADDPQAIAQLVELLIRHGGLNRCQPWLDRLTQSDSDPIRPIAARSQWLAAAGRSAEVPTLVEPLAAAWLAAATDNAERARVARSVGDLYLACNQPDRAELWFRAMTASDPAQFSRLVFTLAREGKFADAVRVCVAQGQTDTGPRPGIVLASMLAESRPPQEQQQTAEEFLAASLARFPQDPSLLYAMATLRAVQDKYLESVRLYREVVRLDPKNVTALNNLAMILAESPVDRIEALATIDKAIAMIGRQPGLLDTKGAILVYLGRADQAVSLLEAAAREAGTDVRHRFHLAAAYHGRGDLEKARDHLRAALDQHLEREFLTQTDRRLLVELKTALIP
jgi:tetratricopeptide (TPR) repeat protein